MRSDEVSLSYKIGGGNIILVGEEGEDGIELDTCKREREITKYTNTQMLNSGYLQGLAGEKLLVVKFS